MRWDGHTCDCSLPSQTGRELLLQRGHYPAPAWRVKEVRCQIQALGKGASRQGLGEVSGPQPCLWGWEQGSGGKETSADQQTKAKPRCLDQIPSAGPGEAVTQLARQMHGAFLTPPDSLSTQPSSAASWGFSWVPSCAQDQLRRVCCKQVGRERVGRYQAGNRVPSVGTPGCVHSGRSRVLLLKVCSPDGQSQHHLEICYQM